MKRTSILVLQMLISGVITLQAQSAIPNEGFENWEQANGASGTYERPQSGWDVSDQLSCTPLSSYKTTEAHRGTYALKLETSDCNLAGGTHEGFALNIFPYGQRPTALKGWYKSQRSNNDSAVIELSLSKWDNDLQQTLAIGGGTLFIHQSASQYTEFTVPVSYFMNGNPDTATIMMFSDKFTGRTVGNNLWIDDLQFTTSAVGLPEQHTLQGFSVYPVPATSAISFDYTVESPSKVKVIIMDITGRVVLSDSAHKLTGATTTKMNIEELKSGIYFYSVEAENHNRMSGKFTKL